ncbi:hypothetical protein NY2A_b544R [Paramecium bursaria Chlorella virus NY2A]|uniref:Uncharacterized protein b544R n=1 Tax=Paramecium bursaria Chlorella virus NY2A TaxID=46021 RepID=A7IX69_PBCVN|nr:hypothetical protein NY2A_b544R [Paramecium bursaria Chlorella virus NY2A]YP_001498569.1 hypothetical protein AR158_c488R [Paramecium bursaria Chlorella virus AR158]ABT14943.1 hypothetical protein NY2A_b544R [Paramecium bursaria Chlorella virus NY2A]ABU44033.1 hypothetical protein AR158_c488R [Paramecium bursaria Chlorella virus AR158]
MKLSFLNDLGRMNDTLSANFIECFMNFRAIEPFFPNGGFPMTCILSNPDGTLYSKKSHSTIPDISG